MHMAIDSVLKLPAACHRLIKVGLSAYRLSHPRHQVHTVAMEIMLALDSGPPRSCDRREIGQVIRIEKRIDAAGRTIL